MTRTLGKDSTCSIARSLEAVGDTWTLLIVREALIANATRFQDFRDALGIAPNILSKRLEKIVEDGLMERRSYQEPGSRSRDAYVLTDAGRSLTLVIGALSDWGRTFRPHQAGTSPEFTLPDSERRAHLAFVTADGEEVDPSQLVAQRAPDR